MDDVDGGPMPPPTAPMRATLDDAPEDFMPLGQIMGDIDAGRRTSTAWEEDKARARADLELAMGVTSSALSAPCDFTSYGDLVRKAIPPTPWLVQGLITDGAVAVIAGEPKAAKTWLALELAVAVALGSKAVGEFMTGPPRGVALFLTEDAEANVRARLRGTVRGHGGHAPDDVEPAIHVKSRGALDLSSIDTLAWFVASIRRLPPVGLVVIDPLRNVMGPLKENDNDDMAKVNAALRALRDVLGATVLYVHHTSKTTEGNGGRRPGQRMRGGGALHGGYDAGIHLSGPTETMDGDATVRRASVDVEVKAGRGAGAFAVELRIHDDDDGHCVRADWSFHRDAGAHGKGAGADLEKAALAVFDRPGAPARMSKSKLATAMGGTKGRALATVDALVSNGRLASVVEGQALMVWPATGSGGSPLKGGEPRTTDGPTFANHPEPPSNLEPPRRFEVREPPPNLPNLEPSTPDEVPRSADHDRRP